MTVSGIASKTVPTRKYSSREGFTPKYFVLHHTAGGSNDGNEQLLSADNGYEVSANYLSRTDGKVTSIVPEQYRAWTTGWNVDKEGITQETVNTTGAPDWRVSQAQLENTARLVADCSRRYGWGKIKYGKNFFVHRNFFPTECPGPFIMSQIQWLENRANQILSGVKPTPAKPIIEEEEEMIRNVITDSAPGVKYELRSDGTKRSIPSPEWNALRALEAQAKKDGTDFRLNVTIVSKAIINGIPGK